MLTAEISGTTRTPILSTCWRLGRFTLYLALFSAQDSLSVSRNFSAPCGENNRQGMLWSGPHHGFPVYVACTTLYPSGRLMLKSYRLDFGHELQSRRSWEVSYA